MRRCGLCGSTKRYRPQNLCAGCGATIPEAMAAPRKITGITPPKGDRDQILNREQNCVPDLVFSDWQYTHSWDVASGQR